MALKGQAFALFLAAPGIAGAVPTTFTEVAFTTSKSLKRAMETIDTTSDTSAGWKTTLAGQRSWSADGEYITEVSNAGQVLLSTAFDSDEHYRLRLVEVTRDNLGVATIKTGGVVYEGWVRITDLSLDTPVNEKVTGSVSFEGDGPVTRGVNP